MKKIYRPEQYRLPFTDVKPLPIANNINDYTDAVTPIKYKNKAQCMKCGSVIESTFRHEFVMCSCGAIFVDGGNEYWRSGGYPENFRRLYEKMEEENG